MFLTTKYFFYFSQNKYLRNYSGLKLKRLSAQIFRAKSGSAPLKAAWSAVNNGCRCFFRVERQERTTQKACAPAGVRNPPVILSLTFDMRTSRPASLFVKGTRGSRVKRKTSSAPSCSRRKRLTVSVWGVGPGQASGGSGGLSFHPSRSFVLQRERKSSICERSVLERRGVWF